MKTDTWHALATLMASDGRESMHITSLSPGCRRDGLTQGKKKTYEKSFVKSKKMIVMFSSYLAEI